MTFELDNECTIRLKVIRPVYETLIINENLGAYIADQVFKTSSDVAHLFKFLEKESKEHFIAVHLNAKNKIICVDRVSTGSLTASIVHPREVMKSTLLLSAAAMILVHNHPSSDPTPSREDIELTRRIKDSADLLGVRLLDHVIVGEAGYYSLADSGII